MVQSTTTHRKHCRGGMHLELSGEEVGLKENHSSGVEWETGSMLQNTKILFFSFSLIVMNISCSFIYVKGGDLFVSTNNCRSNVSALKVCKRCCYSSSESQGGLKGPFTPPLLCCLRATSLCCMWVPWVWSDGFFPHGFWYWHLKIFAIFSYFSHFYTTLHSRHSGNVLGSSPTAVLTKTLWGWEAVTDPRSVIAEQGIDLLHLNSNTRTTTIPSWLNAPSLHYMHFQISSLALKTIWFCS